MKFLPQLFSPELILYYRQGIPSIVNIHEVTCDEVYLGLNLFALAFKCKTVPKVKDHMTLEVTLKNKMALLGRLEQNIQPIIRSLIRNVAPYKLHLN